ncbi:MAG: hypothetical protein H9W81_08845 [Enterococcus sp.]|nr:hypothetical protein [Enterococcus sp.]
MGTMENSDKVVDQYRSAQKNIDVIGVSAIFYASSLVFMGIGQVSEAMDVLPLLMGSFPIAAVAGTTVRQLFVRSEYRNKLNEMVGTTDGRLSWKNYFKLRTLMRKKSAVTVGAVMSLPEHNDKVLRLEPNTFIIPMPRADDQLWDIALTSVADEYGISEKIMLEKYSSNHALENT